MTRMSRVHAFCNWLDMIPPDPPFDEHEDFVFFADLTDAEIFAAKIEMRRRAESDLAEADALEAEGRLPSNDDDPEPQGAA